MLYGGSKLTNKNQPLVLFIDKRDPVFEKQTHSCWPGSQRKCPHDCEDIGGMYGGIPAKCSERLVLPWRSSLESNFKYRSLTHSLFFVETPRSFLWLQQRLQFPAAARWCPPASMGHRPLRPPLYAARKRKLPFPALFPPTTTHHPLPNPPSSHAASIIVAL